jgi:hypothetical protein
MKANISLLSNFQIKLIFYLIIFIIKLKSLSIFNQYSMILEFIVASLIFLYSMKVL